MSMKNKNKKRSLISAQHASENLPDPTDNNSSIKIPSAHYEQKTHSFYKTFYGLWSRIANF